jgi:hypothetical protein
MENSKEILIMWRFWVILKNKIESPLHLLHWLCFCCEDVEIRQKQKH